MVTSSSLVYLIALPLFGAITLLLAGRRADKWGHLLGTAMSASSFGVGLYQLSQMLSRPTEERAIGQKLFTWIDVASFQVDAGLLLDQLSICFVLLITGVGTLIHIYSISYMSHDENRRRFFAYLNLFIAAMLLLVLGDSYLNLYVGWEGVGLASYLLTNCASNLCQSDVRLWGPTRDLVPMLPWSRMLPINIKRVYEIDSSELRLNQHHVGYSALTTDRSMQPGSAQMAAAVTLRSP